MTHPFMLFPRDALNKIRDSSESGGRIQLRHVEADNSYVLDRVGTSGDLTVQVAFGERYQRLKWGDRHAQGQWIRVTSTALNAHHWYAARRPGTSLNYEQFKALVPGLQDPGNMTGILITHQPNLPEELRDLGVDEFAAWLIRRDEVIPISVAMEPETLGLHQIGDTWPLERLQRNSIMIVGCGSIGGAAAQALAAYGIGRLDLVDPDRYLWHNVVRHVLPPEYVGALKVDGLRQFLRSEWPLTEVTPHALNVVEQAHHIRPMLKDVDLVLCAADGIAPRRVVSHLARRAKTPAVLACVLDHGTIGELIRLRPTPRSGCLLCLRRHLAKQGAMDAEADQELDYGTGLVHQPMTAIPTDLLYVGTLAAKIAGATLLQTHHGDATQRLPGEQALLGLSPTGDLKAPFDLQHAGEIRWTDLPAPDPHCPTCGTP